VSTGEKNEHENADVTKRGDGVLRGHDIIPGDSLPKAKSDKGQSGDGRTGAIPQFDLAEDIMAEQRRITAVRRKGPGNKDQATKEKPAAHNLMPVRLSSSESEVDKVIADIVRSDIERLCKGLDS